MEPIAVAGYVAIAANAVLAVMLGAFAGAIAWAVRGSFASAALIAAAAYFGAAVVFGSSRLEAAGIVGVPPLILTFLIAWLAAGYLEARARLRRAWAALLGVGCALLLGFLWGFVFRLGLSAALYTALAIDVGLIVLACLSRKALAR
ncbi:MAG TPA: hypothetical protein VFB93_14925 [Burkholderiales bacterium]|nr:hypothetical protein [Burkholderiales bacterium]